MRCSNATTAISWTTAAPDAPTGLKIERSDATGSGNESIYGRYNVTWNAPTTGSPAIYYHMHRLRDR